MSKQVKRLTDDELAELSWEIQKIVCRCNTVGEGLKLLTSTLATYVDYNVHNTLERDGIMDGCIKQLRKFKKQMQNEIQNTNTVNNRVGASDTPRVAKG